MSDERLYEQLLQLGHSLEEALRMVERISIQLEMQFVYSARLSQQEDDEYAEQETRRNQDRGS